MALPSFDDTQPYAETQSLPSFDQTQDVPQSQTPAPTGDTSAEDNFKSQVSGLDPANAQALQSIPGVGGAVASFADAMSRPIEAAMALPQYAADKFDQYVPGNLANTGLEMVMANAGEGSMEGAASHAIKDARVANALRTGDTDSRALPKLSDTTPVPDAALADPTVIADQRADQLSQMIEDGRDSQYIAQQMPGINMDKLNAVISAKRAGKPYGVAPLETTPNPAAVPVNETAFSAAAQNQANLAQTPEPTGLIADQAAAFQGTPEPRVGDVFPTDETLAQDRVGQEAKLQAEADAFQKAKNAPDPAPAFNDTAPLSEGAEGEDQTTPAGTTSPDEPTRTEALAHAQAVDDHINEVSSDWTNKPDHSVYPSTDDIADPVLKKTMEDNPDALGVYKDGRVHIVADRLEDPSEAKGIFYHEALAHHGLASKFGDALDQHLQNWYDGNHGQFRNDVDQWLKDNPDAYGGKGNPKQVVRAAEEVLAERTERGGKLSLTEIKRGTTDADKPIPPKELAKAREAFEEGKEAYSTAKAPDTAGLRQRIAQTVRQFGRRLGYVKGFSDADIDTIMQMAHSATKDGIESKGANVIKFSRKAANDNIKDPLQHPGKDASHADLAAYHRAWAESMDSKAKTWAQRGLPDNAKNAKDLADTFRMDAAYHANKALTEPKFSRAARLDKSGEDDALSDGDSAEGRSSWKSMIKDDRKNGRRVGESDRAFWGLKKANKSPEEWEAENAGKFATRKRPSQKAPEGGSIEDVENERSKVVRIAGINMGRISSYHDLGGVTDHLVNSQLPQEKMTLEEMKQGGAEFGLNINKALNKSGRVAGGLKNIDQLPKQIAALRQLHTDFMDQAARFGQKFDEDGYNEADHANLLAKMSQVLAIDGKLRADRIAIARAMNAFKITTSSAKAAGAALKELQESGGGMGKLATKEGYEKFMASLKANAGSVQGTANLAQAMVKPYFWEKFITGHNGSMLSGMTTQAKNFMDNTGLMARDFMDVTGATLGGNVKPIELQARMYGFAKSLIDLNAYKHIIESTVDAGRTKAVGNANKYGSNADGAYVPGFSHVLSALEGADHFFKNLHMGMNLRALGVRQALDEGLKGPAALQRAEFLANNASPKFMEAATLQAKRNLLQDASSPMTQWLERAKAIRPGMSPTEQLASFSANILFPFVRVADRSAVRMLERSPLGFIPKLNKSLRDAIESGDKQQRDIAISRAALGTAIGVYYFTQAAKGKITGANSNYNKSNALGVDGYQPNSVDDEDRYTDATAVGTNINPLDLHNATAASVASLYEAYKRGASIGDTLKGITEAGIGLAYENTTLKQVTPVGAAVQSAETGDARGTGSAFVASLAGSMVPNILKTVQKSRVDPEQRDLTGDKSLGDRVKGAVLGNLPTQSEKFPQKYDTFGQPMDTGKTLLGLSNYNMKSTDPTIQEMARIERATKGVLITPVTAAKWKMPGGEVTLTDVQRNEFQKRAGENFRTSANSLVAQSGWKSMPMAQKAAAIKEANKDAKQTAKQAMMADGTIKPEQIVPITDEYQGKL